jgi:hypothetical protein
LVSVLGCGTWFFLIEEQLYQLSSVFADSLEDVFSPCLDPPFGTSPFRE